jgi:hypothetical protein
MRGRPRAILDAVKPDPVRPFSYVRWWETFLIILIALYPAMQLSVDEPPFSWRKYGVYTVAAIVALVGIDLLGRYRCKKAKANTPPRSSART